MEDNKRKHTGVVLRFFVVLLFGLGQMIVFAQESVEPEPYFVTIALNGVDQPGIFPAISIDESFFLEEQAFLSLGTLVPDRFAINYRRRRYIPLAAVSGLTYAFNRAQQHLNIACPARCFPERRLSAAAELPVPDPTPLGAFVNYDLVAEFSGVGNFVGGIAEIGVFSNHGSGILSLSAQDLTDDVEFVRLETNWTIDRPSKRERLRFGDSITRVGGWGQALRFGGIQFGTEFSLQPGFISFPTPTITGGAALPSTADIYVNGLRRESINLEPGPFTIEQPPVITGSGDLLVVVRDTLGRETVITHPFYASRSLLKEGLNEYSFEVGFLRENYAISSNDYADLFAAATFRRGFNDKFTAGVHAEASNQSVAFGPYLDWLLPFGGTLSGAAALSVAEGKVGAIVQTQFDWTGRNVGFSASNEWISRDFRRLGTDPSFPEPVMESSANLGIDISDNSSLSLNYLRIDERNGPAQQVASANFSLQVKDIGLLSLNVARSFGGIRDTNLFLLFTTRIGRRTSASAGVDRSDGEWTATVRAHRAAPSAGGLGLRAEASFEDNERYRAGATYDTGRGVLELDHSQFGGQGTTRIGARGGLVVLDGGPYLTNPVNDSFALVKVGSQAGVDVLRDNRPVGRTNDRGRLFVPRLRAYEANKLSIDPLDLPLTTEIDSTVMLPVPRRRSGVIVEFPIKELIAATARIVDEFGADLPAGTLLRALDNGEVFPVGFNGAAYITGLKETRRLQATLGTFVCVVEVPASKPGAYPRALGQLVCEGVN